jgi:signal transduction histidine kinase
VGRTVLRDRTTWDGATRRDEVRVSPVPGPEGNVTQVVEVWRDITDRRSAEARAADYQRLASLGMLASGFSHEVNTPLSSIDTCLAAIERLIGRAAKEAAPDCGPLLEYARVARAQVERCGTITRQFLQLARGNALSREIIDLPDAVDVVQRLVAPTAQDAGIAVTVTPPPSDKLPPVLANRAAVQQVLLNLSLNAVHASDPGQRVVFAFTLTPDAVEITVSDAGTGIPAEDVGRIFEPFFSRRPGGVGLGLFVSQGFAHGWGGRLRLVSSTPGQGTTFSVLFPRADPGGDPEAGAP